MYSRPLQGKGDSASIKSQLIFVLVPGYILLSSAKNLKLVCRVGSVLVEATLTALFCAARRSSSLFLRSPLLLLFSRLCIPTSLSSNYPFGTPRGSRAPSLLSRPMISPHTSTFISTIECLGLVVVVQYAICLPHKRPYRYIFDSNANNNHSSLA